MQIPDIYQQVVLWGTQQHARRICFCSEWVWKFIAENIWDLTESSDIYMWGDTCQGRLCTKSSIMLSPPLQFWSYSKTCTCEAKVNALQRWQQFLLTHFGLCFPLGNRLQIPLFHSLDWSDQSREMILGACHHSRCSPCPFLVLNRYDSERIV